MGPLDEVVALAAGSSAWPKLDLGLGASELRGDVNAAHSFVEAAQASVGFLLLERNGVGHLMEAVLPEVCCKERPARLLIFVWYRCRDMRSRRV